jgi:hypothetical protein
MNKRIRQLYIQAINDTKHDPADDINIQIAEKFAELIVTECIDQIKISSPDRPYMANQIKKRVGIEE